MKLNFLSQSTTLINISIMLNTIKSLNILTNLERFEIVRIQPLKSSLGHVDLTLSPRTDIILTMNVSTRKITTRLSQCQSSIIKVSISQSTVSITKNTRKITIMGTWYLQCQTLQIKSSKQWMKLQLTNGISKEVQMESMSKHIKISMTTSSYSWTRKLARSTGVQENKKNHQIHRLVPIRDRWQPSMKKKATMPTIHDTKRAMITIDTRKMAITATDQGLAALTIDTTITTVITRMVDTKSHSFLTGPPSTTRGGDPSMTETCISLVWTNKQRNLPLCLGKDLISHILLRERSMKITK